MAHETVNGPVKRYLLLVRWRIQRLNRAQLRRWAYRLSRPASFPYLSGDGFRKLADHVDDAWWERISARRVRAGDILFVTTHHVRRFFEEIDHRIQAPYVLITHNSDLPADEALISSISANVVRWFAQNNTYAHDRVVPVPIGLENLHHYHTGIPERFNGLRKSQTPRKARILVGFSLGINLPERKEAYDAARQVPSADCLPAWLDQKEYMQTLSGYKFVLSPPGNGLDTHRTWEAMYAGAIPIVKESVAMRAFAKLGLPLWIISDWAELRGTAEVDLEAKYEALKPGFSAAALFMDFWRREILACQGEIRGQDAESGPRIRRRPLGGSRDGRPWTE